jgi:hypothetical protein
MFEGKTLYLDGLDECRAKAGDGDVLGKIRSVLFELGRPKFRLSCRSADWYGVMDVARLKGLSQNGELVVVHLEQLSRDDIAEAIRDEIDDPNGFINRADKYGVAPLLGNPQTLRMLVSVVKSGAWPSTRADLFNKATRLLAEEPSPWHSRTEHGQISTNAILSVSGRMYAAMLMGAGSGFSLVRDMSSELFPLITDLFGDDPTFQAAGRRRIFSSEGPERIGPPHRTIAEYMAARFLGQHLQDGFPLSRVLALVTCPDGAVVPTLRGLFAWLIAFCPEHAELLAAKDPMGVVLYGDPSILSRDAKIALLKAFDSLAGDDPWFRAEDWASTPFGGLASSDMEDVFEDYLRTARNRSPTLLSCVLDALQHGAPMPRLGDLLLTISQDNNIAEHLRDDALSAFVRSCPGRQPELLPVLQKVVSGQVEDDCNRLRGFILRILYPTIIGPTAIVDYMSKPNDNHLGGYAMFISHDILKATPETELASLADAVASVPQRDKLRHSHFWGDFAGDLLLRVLHQEGETATPARLYRWLGMNLDEYGQPHSHSRTTQNGDIKKWIQDHPDRFRELFEVWLAEDHASRMTIDYNVLFESRLRHVEPPPDFASWLLDKAKSMQTDDKMANHLFAKATNTVMWGRGSPRLTFDDLVDFVEKTPSFKPLFTELCTSEIPEWRLNHCAGQSEDKAQQEKQRAERISDLSSRIYKIKSGEDWGALFYLGHCYFGAYHGQNRDLSPLDRIADDTTPEIAAAAREGFKNVLYKTISITPHDVGVSASKSKSFNASYVLRAGMRLLTDESQNALTDVHEDNLKLAVAFGFAWGNDDHDKPWMQSLASKNPELVAKTLIDCTRPQLETHSKDHCCGISSLTYGDGMPDVARLTVPTLLKDYPNAKPQVLRDLLRAGLAYCPPDSMLALARSVLGLKGAVRGTSRSLWMGVAHMLAPNEMVTTLVKYIGKSENRILDMLPVFEMPLQRDSKVVIQLTPGYLGTTIMLCGRRFPPWKNTPSGTITSRDEASRTVSSMITILAGMPGAEVTATLQHLVSNIELQSWNDHLRHALQDHLRAERESNFVPPSVTDVACILSTGRPASVADLRALVCAELREIAKELRHGATCGYKVFWNTTTRGGLRSPKGEEQCRDVLVDRLRLHLGRIGVRVEPEARYGEAKRADMKVICGSFAVPIEVKRHMNSELWSAPISQLVERYSFDPEAHGNGIYLVLYYGAGKGLKSMPPRPDGLPRPKNATQLEADLRDKLTGRQQNVIDIVVLDVRRPANSICKPQRLKE